MKTLFQLAAGALPNNELRHVPETLLDRCRDEWRKEVPSLPRHTETCNAMDLDVSIEKDMEGWRWQYMYIVPREQVSEFFNMPPLPPTESSRSRKRREDREKRNDRAFHEKLAYHLGDDVILIRDVHLAWSECVEKAPFKNDIGYFMNYLSNDADPIVKAYYGNLCRMQ